MRGAMILQVNFEILSRQHRGFATVRARYRKSATFGVMGSERVENEFLVTVTTGDESLGALSQLVLAEVSPLHFHPAFILAIQRLVTARACVFLHKSRDFSERLETINQFRTRKVTKL